MPKPARMSKPNEDKTKRIVLCIWTGLSRNWSYQQIADRLNELKIRTVKGLYWTDMNVQQVKTVIDTKKPSWYRWAFELLKKENRLPELC